MKQKLQLSELKKDNIATAHTASLAQDWLSRNCPEFIRKEERPPNSPDLNPLDYHVWDAMLDKYQRYVPKPTNISELKTVLKAIWSDLPQGPIDEAVLWFAKGFMHALKQLVDISNMLCKLMFVTLTFPFALQLRRLLFRVITGWLELLFTE